MTEVVNNILESVKLKKDIPQHMADLYADEKYVCRVQERLVQRKVTIDGEEVVKLVQKSKNIGNLDKHYHGNRLHRGLPTRIVTVKLGSQKCFKTRRNGKVIQMNPVPHFVLTKTAMELIKEGASSLLRNTSGKIKREYLKVLPRMARI